MGHDKKENLNRTIKGPRPEHARVQLGALFFFSRAAAHSLWFSITVHGVWGTAPTSISLLYIQKPCLLALRTVKLPFQSSRVIFLGRSLTEEHLPGIIQAKECMKKKKHISEEQHYLCEIGLEKMPYGSSWLYKSYTEESLTHITITAAPCKVPALPWWIHPLGRRLVGCGSHFLSAWFYFPYL